MSVTSQQFGSKLVNSVHHVQPTGGTGSISAQRGPVYMRLSWILTVTALVDALLITFIVWRSHKRRVEKRNKQHPGPGAGGGYFAAAGERVGAVYQFLVPGGKEGRGLHGGSQVELISSGGRKAMAAGSVTEQASAYEPMRHR